MRLFVAVDVPQAEKHRILEAVAPLREAALPVRWVEPAAFHLTLKFLGEVPDATVPAVKAAVSDVARRHAPFPLELRGAGAFPGARRPSVWWIGVAPSASLHALRDDVEAAISPLGYPTESRPFSPHLTLGRTARDAAPVRDAQPLLDAVRYHGTFTIETLDLMRSHLSPRGARYERVLAAELAS